MIGLLLALNGLTVRAQNSDQAREPANILSVIEKTVAGHWEGNIQDDGIRYIVKVDFFIDKAGILSGNIEVPIWGVENLKLSSAEIKNGALTFVFLGAAGKQGTFSGKLVGGQIHGSYRWNKTTYPFELGRDKVVEDPSRVQLRTQIPKPPFPYRTETVKFRNGAMIIGAGLTLPDSKTPYPAVVIVGGSGAHRWDPEIPGAPGAEEWLWVLSDRLARAGFATLLMDSRGTGDTGGDYEQSELTDLADDAAAALRYLRSRKEINPKKVGMLGHSEGAVIISLAMSKSKDASFAIMLSAPAIPFEEVFLDQQRALYRSSQFTEEAIDRIMQKRRAIFDLLKSNRSIEMVRSEIIRQAGSETEAADRGLLDFLSTVGTPRRRSELRYDPGPAIQKLNVPALLIYGSSDVWVDAQRNSKAALKAFSDGGNRFTTTRIFPGLKHNLCKTSSGLDHTTSDTIDPAVLDLITEWLSSNTRDARK